MSSSRVVTWLPRIPKDVKIGHIPQRLKAHKYDLRRARLEVLRILLSNLFREERIETRHHRAVELRPYAERLLQLGIHRGPNDPYTKQMVDWWILEKDIREKMFEVYVPRFRENDGPFTSVYKLQDQLIERRCDLGVIELNGNPYPPVITDAPDYSNNLLNVLLKNAIKKQMQRLQLSDNNLLPSSKAQRPEVAQTF